MRLDRVSLRNRLVNSNFANVNLIGISGSGKTEFLHDLYNVLKNNPSGNYHTVFIDLSKYYINNSHKFWEILLQQLREEIECGEEFSFKYNETFYSVAEFLQCLSGELTFIIDDIDRFLFVDQFSTDMADLSSLRSLWSNYDVRFIVSTKYPIYHLYKNFIQKIGRTFTESAFITSFRSVYLSSLTEDEFNDLVTMLLKDSFKEIQLNNIPIHILDMFKKEAGYHPKFIKLLVDTLKEEGLPDFNRTIDKEIIYQFYDRVEPYCIEYIEYFDDLTLKLLLDGQLNDNAPVDPKKIKMLLNLGLIVQEDGAFRLFSRAFQYFVESHIQEDDLFLAEDTAYDLPKYRLTPTEERLFTFFKKNPNRLCTIDEIKRAVWDSNKSDAAVEKGIRMLRGKIEEDRSNPKKLINIRGKGYMYYPDKT